MPAVFGRPATTLYVPPEGIATVTTYAHAMDHVAQAFEVAGVAVLVGGFALGLGRALIDLGHDEYLGIYGARSASSGTPQHLVAIGLLPPRR